MSVTEKIYVKLKKANRTLLEMYVGIISLGIVGEVVGLFFAPNKARFSLGLLIGIVLAMASALHMYVSLDRALDFEESKASKKMMTGYLIRYFLLAIVLALVCITDIANPLVVFFSLMTLKVTALIQPITHKLTNKFFNETDPVPQALDELEDEGNKTGGDN